MLISGDTDLLERGDYYFTMEPNFFLDIFLNFVLKVLKFERYVHSINALILEMKMFQNKFSNIVYWIRFASW